MSNVVKPFIFIISMFMMLSCTPSAPYEIRSPCVAIESDTNAAINPCIRRPVNMNRAIA